ncbi:energy transducer TonB [Uliginosibacterium sp. 31-12]|uniref:energy transducer TonB n=1 Tax=Uliginosibacterium sp. 31-12 TaxID=3062781 RepID=UPI0026E34085|nr:energy transducer TonB [Uliginosibacterium sp. 31-12]MDO6388300.1 TonB family protein [Uliginosibacterium sp. 31-12]
MKPAPTPSALPSRPPSGRLRWSFAWLMACLLTSGMLDLLAGMNSPQVLRKAADALQVSLLTEPAPPSSARQPLATPAAASAGQTPAPTLTTPVATPAAQRPVAGSDSAAVGTAALSEAEPTAPAHAASAATTREASAPVRSLAQRCPHQVKPVFPPLALEDGVETGRVTVRLHLDSEGRVREVSLVEASPQGYFEAATRRAALQWRCLPPAEAGETLRVPFEFGIAAH